MPLLLKDFYKKIEKRVKNKKKTGLEEDGIVTIHVFLLFGFWRWVPLLSVMDEIALPCPCVRADALWVALLERLLLHRHNNRCQKVAKSQERKCPNKDMAGQ